MNSINRIKSMAYIHSSIGFQVNLLISISDYKRDQNTTVYYETKFDKEKIIQLFQRKLE